MMTNSKYTTRRLVSQIGDGGMLALRIVEAALPAPQPGEILLEIEAAPLHPSDMGMMLLAADVARAERASSGAVLIPIPEFAQAMMQARLATPLPLGNEGAGIVRAAGDAAGEAWIGRRVAAFGGGMYASHRIIRRDAATLLPEGTSARDGAAISVNPLTALAMVEVMRQSHAKALVHTAAASSLGQMLQRICAQDGIALVNIVRRPEQAAVLRALGATHVLDSSDPAFDAHTVTAFAEVNATLAFDAVGGGPLAGALLTAMEAAQQRRNPSGSFYGSAEHKQVYIYGRLNPGPTSVPPSVGMAWSVGGFLLPHFLAGASAEVAQRMTARVLAELTTNFAINYTAEISLTDFLDPRILQQATAKSTNAKFLLRPNN
jgi:NADPH:quinone reductase